MNFRYGGWKLSNVGVRVTLSSLGVHGGIAGVGVAASSVGVPGELAGVVLKDTGVETRVRIT